MNEGGRVGESIAGPVQLDQAKRWMRSEKSGKKNITALKNDIRGFYFQLWKKEKHIKWNLETEM